MDYFSKAVVILVGRIGNVEPKETKSGKKLANLSIAITDSEKVDGEYKQTTMWTRVVAFGNIVDTIIKHGKGSLVTIVGSLRERKWQDKDGKTNYTTEVILRDYTLIKKGGETATYEAPVGNEEVGPEDGDLPF